MSAGICVMNKCAVALAADSAVTVGNHLAVHNNANKLFAISKYAPVGVIMYANSDFMGIPFELIIKQYKKQLEKQTYKTLREYVDSFMTFLCASEELYHFGQYEKKYFLDFCDYFCNGFDGDIKELHDKNVEKKGGPLNDTEMLTVFQSIIEATEKYVTRLELLPNSFAEYIRATYENDISDWLQKRYNWIDKSNVSKLFNLIIIFFDRYYFNSSFTGLAFAGYGESELFPSMIHIHLSGIIQAKPRFKEINSFTVTHDLQSVIQPLAQTDVMQTFMLGVSERVLTRFNHQMLSILVKDIKDLPDECFSPGKKESVEEQIKKSAERVSTEIIREAVKESWAPFYSAAASLPITDLAMFAESMINITSFRRKIALDQNIDTVGGPIDVAVISKVDGFVWVRRKHYFSLDNNLQYVLNCLDRQKECAYEKDDCSN